MLLCPHCGTIISPFTAVPYACPCGVQLREKPITLAMTGCLGMFLWLVFQIVISALTWVILDRFALHDTRWVTAAWGVGLLLTLRPALPLANRVRRRLTSPPGQH